MSKKNKIHQKMKNVLCRVIKGDLDNDSQISLKNNLTLQKELGMQIKSTTMRTTLKRQELEKRKILKKY